MGRVGVGHSKEARKKPCECLGFGGSGLQGTQQEEHRFIIGVKEL